MSTAKLPQGWYFHLLDKVSDLSQRHALSIAATDDIRRLSIETARAQFKAGNYSGIEWLKRFLKTKGKNSGQFVCPDCFAPYDEHARTSCNE